LKILLCALLALLLAGCLPIGVRGSSLFTTATAPAQPA
jgi:hypothetical protein